MIFSKLNIYNQRFALNILVPSLYLVPLIVAYFSPKYFGFGYRFLVQAGLSVGLIGLILWVVSIWHLGSSLAVIPGTKELVTQGIYKYIRHPMYLGISLTICGLMLACGSFFGMAYLIGVVLPVNALRSRLEEDALANQFGKVYLTYKSNTWF